MDAAGENCRTFCPGVRFVRQPCVCRVGPSATMGARLAIADRADRRQAKTQAARCYAGGPPGSVGMSGRSADMFACAEHATLSVHEIRFTRPLTARQSASCSRVPYRPSAPSRLRVGRGRFVTGMVRSRRRLYRSWISSEFRRLGLFPLRFHRDGDVGFLLMPQGFDRIQIRGVPRGVQPEHDADGHTNAYGEHDAVGCHHGRHAGESRDQPGDK